MTVATSSKKSPATGRQRVNPVHKNKASSTPASRRAAAKAAENEDKVMGEPRSAKVAGKRAGDKPAAKGKGRVRKPKFINGATPKAPGVAPKVITADVEISHNDWHPIEVTPANQDIWYVTVSNRTKALQEAGTFKVTCVAWDGLKVEWMKPTLAAANRFADKVLAGDVNRAYEIPTDYNHAASKKVALANKKKANAIVTRKRKTAVAK